MSGQVPQGRSPGSLLVHVLTADVAKFRVPEKLLTLNRVSIVFIALKYIIKIEYGFYLAAHKSTYHGCKD